MKLRILMMTLAVLCISVMAVDRASAQKEEMLLKDWQTEMDSLQALQTQYETEKGTLEGEITGLKEEMGNTEKETDMTWKEIYALIGTDENGVAGFRDKMNTLEAKIGNYASMSDKDLSEKLAELDALLKEVKSHKKDRHYALTEFFNKVNELENRVNQLIQRGKNYKPPKPKHDTYVVKLGDYLWRISGKAEIYKDPFQWIKIYSANRTQIKNPDLIYANQSFRIPRSVDPGEYWVKKGDFLAKIAKEQMGNPSSWVKIYQANKDVIDIYDGDSNRIYPHTILLMPK